MKTFFTHLLCLLSLSLAAQQTDWCGTVPSSHDIQYMNQVKQTYEQVERAFLQDNGRSLPVVDLPLKIHIIRRTNGTGGYSTTDLQTALAAMNTFYINANLQFSQCGAINYIDDDTYYDFSFADDATFTSTHNDPNLINVYFFNSISSSSGAGLCGYTSFPGGNDRIMMDNGCANNGSTLAHEMGHFLGLYHTHGKTNTGTTDELVDGSNCSNHGDDICDTPADPNLSGLVTSNCTYTGSATDANGDTYVPDPNNVMSYSRKACRTFFSPQQYARTYSIATTVRNYFVCNLIYSDFQADVTFTCDTVLTVQFTDSSTGATAWQWDVDSDGTIDYTTQTVTHTYTGAGNYDVTLVITGPNGTDTRVKMDYISVGTGVAMPYLEDFEAFPTNTNGTGLLNGWENTPQGTTSDYRWTVDNGGTPSSGTGPSNDNTLQNNSGHYIFTEATNSSAGDTALLISPCVEVTGNMPVVDFYTHRYGSNMGDMHVDLYVGGTWINDIIPVLTGAPQLNSLSPFTPYTVDLSSYVNQTVRLRFRAIRGSSFRSDMAIDDVHFYDALPSNITTQVSNQQLRVAPNPSQGIFRVQMEMTKVSSGQVLVHNTLGQVVTQLAVNLDQGLNTWEIDLSMLPAGNYILSVHDGEQVWTERLSKLN